MKFGLRKTQWAGLLAAAMTIALLVSCTGFFPGETLASFVLSPTNPTVPYQGTAQIRAFGTNTDGSSAGDVTSKLTWKSANSGVISVNGGTITGVSETLAPVGITASYQALTSQTANATVCIPNGTPSGMTITPANGTQVSTSMAFPNGGVTASLTAGGTFDITAGVQWSSSNSNLTITGGTSPATVTLTPITGSNQSAIVTANYPCGNTTVTQQVTYTLTP